MAIRYDKKLENELSRIINNYNRKIARLNNKNAEFVPEKISKRKLKETYSTRKELRQEINRLKRFTKRGSEEIITTKKGLKLSKWEIENIKIERQRAFRKINGGLKMYEIRKPKVLGKVQAVTFAQMGSTEYTNLLAKKKILKNKNINYLDKAELDRYKKMLRNINKPDESLGIKENMIEIIEKNGYMAGINNNTVEKIVEALESVDYRNFKDLIEDEKAIKVMFNYYNMLRMPTFNPKNVEDDLITLYEGLADIIDSIVADYV